MPGSHGALSTAEKLLLARPWLGQLHASGCSFLLLLGPLLREEAAYARSALLLLVLGSLCVLSIGPRRVLKDGRPPVVQHADGLPRLLLAVLRWKEPGNGTS